MNELETTMQNRGAYDAMRIRRIEDLKSRVVKKNTTAEQRYYLLNELIEEYEPFNFDSTQHYLHINHQLAQSTGSKEYSNATTLKIAQILASSGRYFEAIEYLNKVRANELEQRLQIAYFKDYIKVYTDLGIYSPIPNKLQNYWSIANTYTDSLRLLLEKGSEDYLALEEKKYRDNWLFRECEEINNKRLALTQPGTRQYSQVTFERSLLYEMEGNTEARKKYLILSAISDIESAVKDNASLTTLAILLHKEGDINRAYRFIKFAYEDASFYNSRLRFTLISNILPVINEAYQMRAEKQKKKLRSFLFIISCLSGFLLIAIYFIYRQLKTLNRAQSELVNANDQLKSLNNSLKEKNQTLNVLNEELSESNLVKEHYIANFLSICSNYIDKLDALNKGIGKQINAGKVEDLFKQSKSRKLMDQEVKEFYHNFDEIFLHIYPHFVEEVNALLEENEQITLKSNESLNTELRVFALIRLGINDSSRIAKLLRYSVNTIYNYRVKIKNKAKGNRDEFEQNIMKIDAVKS
ncbi:hypothetical protein J1N10_06100 [Carboxylicivirga sp. A043]|uniref:DUF6377 domain-containing protein n=1 Tax=Carboxylicivirga litoralis TaxID=2816963 RepID=UPI0021CB4D7C|nr:DUF6377 domain-containing protein [Carboxylicivirga sp. A043]MCU4155540.1 hypothetical protein [Carboxylicivirga sp. A043]